MEEIKNPEIAEDADMGYGRRTRTGLANKIVRASRQNIMVERGMMEQLIVAKVRNNDQTKWLEIEARRLLGEQNLEEYLKGN